MHTHNVSTGRINVMFFNYLTSMQMEFEATRGTGDKGDIAIDDIQFYRQPCLREYNQRGGSVFKSGQALS